MTDEEIVKALERCGDIDNCYDCPIMGEMERRNCMCQEVVLDLIHRLQKEKKELQETVHDMSWVIKIHKYCVGANHCQNRSYGEFELQKQVEELMQANIDLWNANQCGVKFAKNPYKGVEVE